MATAKDVLDRAAVLTKNGEIEKAKQFYQAIIDRMPDSAEAVTARQCLDELNKPAEPDFDDLLAEIPENRNEKEEKNTSFSAKAGFHLEKPTNQKWQQENAPVHQLKANKGRLNKKVAAVLIVLIVAVAIIVIGTTLAGTKTATSDQAEKTRSHVKKAASNEQVIYEDNNLKATFLGVSDKFGYIMINVHFENKTDGELTVYPIDGSVNGTMVTYTSGVPATMQAHKNFNQSWNFNHETVGIKKASEVKNKM